MGCARPSKDIKSEYGMGILYKYTSSKGIKFILEEGTLCFSSNTELNDPFEFGSNMESLVDEQKPILWPLIRDP